MVWGGKARIIYNGFLWRWQNWRENLRCGLADQGWGGTIYSNGEVWYQNLQIVAILTQWRLFYKCGGPCETCSKIWNLYFLKKTRNREFKSPLNWRVWFVHVHETCLCSLVGGRGLGRSHRNCCCFGTLWSSNPNRQATEVGVSCSQLPRGLLGASFMPAVEANSSGSESLGCRKPNPSSPLLAQLPEALPTAKQVAN